MKKKSLKALSLNKQAISKLQAKNIVGGDGVEDPIDGSWLFPGCDTHPKICPPPVTKSNACNALTALCTLPPIKTKDCTVA